MTPEHTALVDAFQYAVETGNHNGVARKALLDALREQAGEIERMKILCESGGTKLLTMMLERDALRVENERLKEYEWMYRNLCK